METFVFFKHSEIITGISLSLAKTINLKMYIVMWSNYDQNKEHSGIFQTSECFLIYVR